MEIYLDNSATTKVCPEAVAAAVRAMEQEYGNAASLHRKGFLAEQEILSAKRSIAKAIACQPEELYFTSGATESNNWALIGAAMAHKRRGNRLITTTIEHASVLHTMDYLESQGFEVVRVSPNADGNFDPQMFADAVNDRTILVSCMLVNNETGLRLPVEAIAKAVKRKNPETLMHTDAVQGFLKLPFRVKNTGIDLLSVSGHKVYAPKGIGILYRRKGVRILPLLHGGEQQNGERPGTDNVPLIAAFGAAVEAYFPHQRAYLEQYTALCSRLCGRLAEIPGVSIHHDAERMVPYILNISCERLRSEVLMHYLEQAEIYVSSSSACARGEKSHVLRAMGLPDAEIDTALRISFSKDTTPEMVDAFADRLATAFTELEKIGR